MTARLLAIAWVALALAWPGVAGAEDASVRAAKRYYERGQKLFDLQKFDQALEQFQKAYDAKPLPDFLFNIGQCHRNLGDFEAAIFSYKKYLKLDPTSKKRDRVEQLIRELEDKLALKESERRGLTKPADDPTVVTKPSLQPRPPQPPPESPKPPPAIDKPLYTKWWFWTGIVVVGAGAGVGIYTATSGGPPATDLGHAVFPK